MAGTGALVDALGVLAPTSGLIRLAGGRIRMGPDGVPVVDFGSGGASGGGPALHAPSHYDPAGDPLDLNLIPAPDGLDAAKLFGAASNLTDIDVSGIGTIEDLRAATLEVGGTVLIGTGGVDLRSVGITAPLQMPVGAPMVAHLDAQKLGGQDSAWHQARANHTGTQLASTISDFAVAVAATPPAAHALSGAQHTGVLAYSQMPTGSGSWDVGSGNTLTLPRAVLMSSTLGLTGRLTLGGDAFLERDGPNIIRTIGATNASVTLAIRAANTAGGVAGGNAELRILDIGTNAFRFVSSLASASAASRENLLLSGSDRDGTRLPLVVKTQNAAGADTVAMTFAAGANAGNVSVAGSLTASAALSVGTTLALAGIATATTVGAAGGASALPATPTGYITVSILGTNRKIPYYAT